MDWSEKCDLILEIIGENPEIGQTQLAKAAGMSSPTLRKYVGALVDAGEVEIEEGPNRTKLHFIANVGGCYTPHN